MRPYELIKAKREGQTLAAADIARFIADYTRGTIPDYQMSAMCMAIFFKGLSGEELSAWTRAMLESGEVIDLSEISGVKVDKHSTGGVGDKVSLCLAPLAAVCGVKVPMVSGRGLGHTGGTLDKLESIPGFRVNLNTSDYRRLVRDLGVCLIGQTETLAPADRKLYALRDVTATVDCIPLIASSIMSKKLAEGIDALVLDVKVGSGAFMKRIEDARKLARTMITIGAQMNRKVTALLTDMDQPLGCAVGNTLEVDEAVDVLKGTAPPDLTELTFALTAEMMLLAQVAKDEREAREQLQAAIESGAALRKLIEIVQAQGGDAKAIEDPARMPRAQSQREVLSPASGFVEAIDTETVGLAAMGLGAGRERTTDRVDPGVGFVLRKKVGDAVMQGEPLAVMHYNDEPKASVAAARLASAYRIGAERPNPRPLVLERME